MMYKVYHRPILTYWSETWIFLREEKMLQEGV